MPSDGVLPMLLDSLRVEQQDQLFLEPPSRLEATLRRFSCEFANGRAATQKLLVTKDLLAERFFDVNTTSGFKESLRDDAVALLHQFPGESVSSFHKIGPRGAVAKPPRIAFARTGKVVEREMFGDESPRRAVAKPPRIAFARTGKVVDREMLGDESPRRAPTSDPPVIHLEGTGKRVVTTYIDGQGIRHTVQSLGRTLLHGTEFINSGASAYDSHGIDLTPTITTQLYITSPTSLCELTGVQEEADLLTLLSLPPGWVATIVYRAVDSAGQSAYALRVLTISCVYGLVACQDPPGVDAPACFSPSSLEVELSLEASTLSLNLVGPSAEYVPFASVYLPCTASDDARVMCDRGATAQDELDGDLTHYVKACADGSGNEETASLGDISFLSVGLTLCGIDTQKPGTYPVTFSVSNSQGVRVTAVRYVVVVSACSFGTQASPAGDAEGCGATESETLSPGALLDRLFPPPAAPQPTISLLETVSLGTLVLSCPPEDCWLYGCRGYEYAQVGLAPCEVDTAMAQAEVGDTLSVRFVVYGDAWPPEAESVERLLEVVDGCSGREIYLCDGVCSESMGTPWPSFSRIFVPLDGHPTAQAHTSNGADSRHLQDLSPGQGFGPGVHLQEISTLGSLGLRVRGRRLLQGGASVGYPEGIVSELQSSTIYAAYGQPLPVPLGTCSSSQLQTGGPDGELTCGVSARDSNGDDLTVSVMAPAAKAFVDLLSPADPDRFIPSCDPLSVSRGTCLPGMYNLSFVVWDKDMRGASTYQLAVVEGRIQVELWVQVPKACDSSNGPAGSWAGSGAGSVPSPQQLQDSLPSNQSFLEDLVFEVLPTLGLDLLSVRWGQLTAVSVESLPADTTVCLVNTSLVLEMGCIPPISISSDTIIQHCPCPVLSASTPKPSAPSSVGELARASVAPVCASTTPQVGKQELINSELTALLQDSAILNLQVQLYLGSIKDSELDDFNGQYAGLLAYQREVAVIVGEEFRQAMLLCEQLKGNCVSQLSFSSLSTQLGRETSNSFAMFFGMTSFTLALAALFKDDSEAISCSLQRMPQGTFGFIVGNLEGTASNAEGRRRRLGAANTWEGYPMDNMKALVMQGYKNPNSEGLLLEDIPPRRVVGATNNQIIGGLFLHQTRRPLESSANPWGSCSGSSHFAKAYTRACQVEDATEVDDPAEGVVPGRGVDPSMQPRSSLFHQAAYNQPEEWYNMTAPNPLVSDKGTVLGFEMIPLHGLPDGFPFVLPVSVNKKRFDQMMAYLKDGRCLDAKYTSSLKAQVATFNQDLRVYGLFQAVWTWGTNGAIKAKFEMVSLTFHSLQLDARGTPNAQEAFVCDILVIVAMAAFSMFWLLEASPLLESWWKLAILQLKPVPGTAANGRNRNASDRASLGWGSPIPRKTNTLNPLTDVGTKGISASTAAEDRYRGPSRLASSPCNVVDSFMDAQIYGLLKFDGSLHTLPGSPRSGRGTTSTESHNPSPRSRVYAIAEGVESTAAFPFRRSLGSEVSDAPIRRGYAVAEGVESEATLPFRRSLQSQVSAPPIRHEEVDLRMYNEVQPNGLPQIRTGQIASDSLRRGKALTNSESESCGEVETVGSPRTLIGTRRKTSGQIASSPLSRDKALTNSEGESCGQVETTKLPQTLIYTRKKTSGQSSKLSNTNTSQGASGHSLSREKALQESESEPKSSPNPTPVTQTPVDRSKVMWFIYDACIVLLMAAALTTLLLHLEHFNSENLPREGIYDVYDADQHAPSHYLMLKRKVHATASEEAIPLPGQPLRWTLPEDRSGMEALSDVFKFLEKASSTWLIYALIQSIILLLLLIRIISLLVFYPTLAIIPFTLIQAAPDILYFGIAIMVTVIMYAMLLSTCMGTSVEVFSDLGKSVYITTRSIVAVDAQELFQACYLYLQQTSSTAASYTIPVVAYAGSLLVIVIANSYMLAIFLTVFKVLKAVVLAQAWRHTTITSEGTQQVRWGLETIFRGAPSNDRIERMIEAMLAARARQITRASINWSVDLSKQTAACSERGRKPRWRRVNSQSQEVGQKVRQSVSFRASTRDTSRQASQIQEEAVKRLPLKKQTSSVSGILPRASLLTPDDYEEIEEEEEEENLDLTEHSRPCTSTTKVTELAAQTSINSRVSMKSVGSMMSFASRAQFLHTLSMQSQGSNMSVQSTVRRLSIVQSSGRSLSHTQSSGHSLSYAQYSGRSLSLNQTSLGSKWSAQPSGLSQSCLNTSMAFQKSIECRMLTGGGGGPDPAQPPGGKQPSKWGRIRHAYQMAPHFETGGKNITAGRSKKLDLKSTSTCVQLWQQADLQSPRQSPETPIRRFLTMDDDDVNGHSESSQSDSQNLQDRSPSQVPGSASPRAYARLQDDDGMSVHLDSMLSSHFNLGLHFPSLEVGRVGDVDQRGSSIQNVSPRPGNESSPSSPLGGVFMHTNPLHSGRSALGRVADIDQESSSIWNDPPRPGNESSPTSPLGVQMPPFPSKAGNASTLGSPRGGQTVPPPLGSPRCSQVVPSPLGSPRGSQAVPSSDSKCASSAAPRTPRLLRSTFSQSAHRLSLRTVPQEPEPMNESRTRTIHVDERLDIDGAPTYIRKSSLRRLTTGTLGNDMESLSLKGSHTAVSASVETHGAVSASAVNARQDSLADLLRGPVVHQLRRQGIRRAWSQRPRSKSSAPFLAPMADSVTQFPLRGLDDSTSNASGIYPATSWQSLQADTASSGRMVSRRRQSQHVASLGRLPSLMSNMSLQLSPESYTLPPPPRIATRRLPRQGNTSLRLSLLSADSISPSFTTGKEGSSPQQYTGPVDDMPPIQIMTSSQKSCLAAGSTRGQATPAHLSENFDLATRNSMTSGQGMAGSPRSQQWVRSELYQSSYQPVQHPRSLARVSPTPEGYLAPPQDVTIDGQTLDTAVHKDAQTKTARTSDGRMSKHVSFRRGAVGTVDGVQEHTSELRTSHASMRRPQTGSVPFGRGAVSMVDRVHERTSVPRTSRASMLRPQVGSASFGRGAVSMVDGVHKRTSVLRTSRASTRRPQVGSVSFGRRAVSMVDRVHERTSVPRTSRASTRRPQAGSVPFQRGAVGIVDGVHERTSIATVGKVGKVSQLSNIGQVKVFKDFLELPRTSAQASIPVAGAMGMASSLDAPLVTQAYSAIVHLTMAAKELIHDLQAAHHSLSAMATQTENLVQQKRLQQNLRKKIKAGQSNDEMHPSQTGPSHDKMHPFQAT
eukprot:gene21539-28531_t